MRPMMPRSALLAAAALVVAAATGQGRAQEPVAEPLQSLFNGTGLGEVRALAATADGRHLYAAGNADRALVAFSRSSGSGRLSQIAVYREGVGGVSGIELANRLRISADDRLLWAIGGDAVATFRRDDESGELAVVQTLRGFGISQPVDAAPTADGTKLFAVGSSAVAMLRVAASGELTPQVVLNDGIDAEALAGARAVAVGTAGDFVYVGSTFDRAITVFRHLEESMETVQVASAASLDPAWFGEFTDLWVAPGGTQLFATVRDRDTVAVFAIGGDGRLTPQATLSDDGQQRGLIAPTRLTGSADGTRLYVASESQSSVAQLGRDPADGSTTLLKTVFSNRDGVVGMTGASDVALGPAQTHVYASGPGDAAIAVFDAALTFMAVERNSAGAVAGLRQPTSVAISPDGLFAYTTGFGDRAVSIFARTEDGTLAFSEVYRGLAGERLDQPIALAMDPDGEFLLVADFGSEAVRLLLRDPSSGSLTAGPTIGSADGITDLRGVAGVAIAADRTLAAAISVLSDTVILFDLTPDEPSLSFRGTMSGLDQPSSLTFSGDAAYLYSASSGAGAVLAFERQAQNPSFPRVDLARDGEDGVNGLDGVASIAIAPDGDHLYSASGGGIFQLDGANAVATFARDPGSGALDFVESIDSDAVEAGGLLGATAVAVSPDATLVAVAGFAGNSVTLLHRAPASGRLEPAQVFSTANGNGGLSGASALAFSPRGAELYATAFADNALHAFRILATAPLCPGDCDGDGMPVISELIRCVNLALDGGAVDACPACDPDGSGSVGINDLIQAVNASLQGCPQAAISTR